jgi:hypothetical protein
LIRIVKGTVLRADGAASQDQLHERFAIQTINHPQTYRRDGACPELAEEYVCRRRAEIGIHHQIAAADRHQARAASWRQNHRCLPNGGRLSRIAVVTIKRGKPSR